MKKSITLFILFFTFLFFVPTSFTVLAESDTSVKEDEPIIDPPIPSKPIVNKVSNRDVSISGTADPYSIVWVIVNNKEKYSIKLEENSTFEIFLKGGKPLKEGSTVTVFAVNDVGQKSQTVELKVLDEIPPAIPKVEKISNLSFSISGKTSPQAVVYIRKNNKDFKTIKANSSGKFSFRMPLQSAGTKFEIFAEDQAKNKSKSTIIKVHSQKRASKKMLSAPIVKQMPELPRGCEVTSLAMLLGDAGVKVNKMTLASKVRKDPTPYQVKNGKIYFGNPYDGFVGNMYTFSKPGLGVFNGPIEELADQYLPGRIVNLTNDSFDDVLNYIAVGKPVWVINTSWFSRVPDSYWRTWHTPSGKIRITYKQHSVLVTGYDQKYIYFNDPLVGKSKKAIKSFIEGWKQYGSQAISYY